MKAFNEEYQVILSKDKYEELINFNRDDELIELEADNELLRIRIRGQEEDYKNECSRSYALRSENRNLSRQNGFLTDLLKALEKRSLIYIIRWWLRNRDK